MFLFFSLSPLVLSSTPSLLHVPACVRGASLRHQLVGPQPARLVPNDGCEPRCAGSGLRIWALVALCHRRSIAPGRYCCKARYPQVESSA
ncbi:hypothetical protein FA13DRAFT_1736657, partial [Coprinellus micaceus]